MAYHLNLAIAKILHRIAMSQGDKIMDEMMTVFKLITEPQMYRALELSAAKIKKTPRPTFKDIPHDVQMGYLHRAIGLITDLEKEGYVIKRTKK